MLAEYAAQPDAVPVLAVQVQSRRGRRAGTARRARCAPAVACSTSTDALRKALKAPPNLPASLSSSGGGRFGDPSYSTLIFGRSTEIAGCRRRRVDDAPVDPATVPEWLRPLVEGRRRDRRQAFSRLSPPAAATTRAAAVLILFGEGDDTARTCCCVRRADTLGSHAGQVAFPGGGADPDGRRTGRDGAARGRGGDRCSTRPACARWRVLPDLYVPVSGFVVTPVLAHWDEPMPVHAVDPAETAAVAQVPIADLADPANRFTSRHPRASLDRRSRSPGCSCGASPRACWPPALALGGWERPWDATDVRDLDEALRVHVELRAGRLYGVNWVDLLVHRARRARRRSPARGTAWSSRCPRSSACWSAPSAGIQLAPLVVVAVIEQRRTKVAFAVGDRGAAGGARRDARRVLGRSIRQKIKPPTGWPASTTRSARSCRAPSCSSWPG